MTDEVSVRIELLRKKMLEFIDQNPGAIKQELVNQCDGYGSRKTIDRELKLFAVNDVIRIEKEKPNSQRHKLFMNRDSDIYKVTKNLDILRDGFFKLIDKLKDKDKIGILAGEDAERIESLNFGPDEQDKIEPAYDLNLAQLSLNMLFQHLLGMYMLYFLFEWPKKIVDDKTLNKLYSLTFQTIKEIRTEISRTLPGYNKFSDTNFRNDLVNRMFVLNTYRLCATVINLKNVGIIEQTEAVVDALWKFSSPFVPSDTSLFHLVTEEDGDERRLIEDWRIPVKPIQKIDDKLDKSERDAFWRQLLHN